MTVPLHPAPTVAGAPVELLKRSITYPETAVPSARLAAAQVTVMLSLSPVALGVLPAGMVRAPDAAAPIPPADQAAEAVDEVKATAAAARASTAAHLSQ